MFPHCFHSAVLIFDKKVNNVNIQILLSSYGLTGVTPHRPIIPNERGSVGDGPELRRVVVQVAWLPNTGLIT
jgi:hypothetical protein